jgi:hypothetical protein
VKGYTPRTDDRRGHLRPAGLVVAEPGSAAVLAYVGCGVLAALISLCRAGAARFRVHAPCG